MAKYIVFDEFTTSFCKWMTKFHISDKEAPQLKTKAISSAVFRSNFISRFTQDPSVINMSIVYDILPWKEFEQDEKNLKLFTRDLTFISEALAVKNVFNDEEFTEIMPFLEKASSRQVLTVASVIGSILSDVYSSKVKKLNPGITSNKSPKDILLGDLSEKALSLCIGAISSSTHVSTELCTELSRLFNKAFPATGKVSLN